MLKKGLSLFLALVIGSLCGFSAQAVTTKEITDKINDVTKQLQSCNAPTVGSIGGEWLVIGLARSGKLPDDFAKSYYNNVLNTVKSTGGAKLHRAKSTENSRLIIALTAIGKDPQNIAGFNLIEPLADFSYVKKQGINGPIWALIAIDTLQYEIPADSSVQQQTTRERLISYILENQCPKGGWDLSGETADPDITGMALQALAPYYTSNKSVKQAVDKSLKLMSDNQNNDGSFSTGGEVTPESSAQMITALSALNIDCNKDEQFIKNNYSPLDSLMYFSVTGGFAHTIGNGYNQMSTEQGYYALTAYNRLLHNQNSLYDMTDLLKKGDIDLNGKVTIDDATLLQRYLADLVSLSRLQIKMSNLYSDGIITIDDVTMLQKQLVE